MRLFDQIISLIGAALILAAYVALQRGWMQREDQRYNALNLVGSVLLTYSAALVGVFAGGVAVGIVSLGRRLRR